MKNVAAYMLANLGGQGGSVESCTAILGSVGCEVDSEKLGALCASLEGKDIIEVLAAGRAKMSTMPAGGAAAGGDAPAAAKEPEPEPEEEEEDMGFDLFD